jgi:hypothetical protein
VQHISKLSIELVQIDREKHQKKIEERNQDCAHIRNSSDKLSANKTSTKSYRRLLPSAQPIAAQSQLSSFNHSSANRSSANRSSNAAQLAQPVTAQPISAQPIAAQTQLSSLSQSQLSQFQLSSTDRSSASKLRLTAKVPQPLALRSSTKRSA